jgi:hypothetical protein
MSSINYLRKQFSKLETEEERNMFCYKIAYAEYWGRSEEQKDLLPESFLNHLLDNLRAALDAEGRVDLYDRFVELVRKVHQDYQVKK